jgi:predicted nucleic acid-binding protein
VSLVVSDTSPLRALQHLGETDVLQHFYRSVLVPPAVARELVTAAGLKVIGVLGILQRAKREGLIDQVRSRMDRLRNGIPFFISDQLYEAVLRSAGEWPRP